MTDSTPTRRSARGQVRNKKYNFDTFEVLNIIGSDSEPSSGTPPKLDASDDEEFPGDAIIDESDLDDDIASASNPHSDRSGNATPEGEYESPTRDSNKDLLDPGMVPASFRFLHRHIGVNNERESKQSIPVEGQHSRGLPHYDSHQSKYAQIKYLIGTNPEDLHDFTQAIDKWARDATLPTRIPNEQGCGGMSFPFVHDLQKRLTNPLTESKWRYSINHEQGSKNDQKTRILDAPHGSKYLPKGHAHYSFLMGPYGDQKLYTLSAQEKSSISRYWRPTTSSGTNEQDGRDMSSLRNGWLLNAGSEIQSLAWAPNKPGGSQYLAIATTHAEPADRKLHSAFQPSSSYPACINLWRFQASAESDHKKSNMDMGVEPHIVQTICTNWGAVKQIRWCPASRRSQYEEETTAFVGLLAGIWSDGYIRVLVIKLDEHQKSSAIYVLYDRAAFAARPPNTICTCLEWMSASELAVGCANGFVAIWNLAELHSADQSPSLAADECDSEFHYRPSFYHSLHPSYILSLSTALPSHDYLLVSCSIDGYFRLTDIRNPMMDFVFSQRTRTITPAVDYHPHIQCFISADDNDFIRAAPIRRFQSQQAFAKAGGHVTSISVGKCHVSTLISSADGTVIITNPMRKVLDGKAEQYQQIWFRHEWVHKPASQDIHPLGDADYSKPKSINRMNVPRSGISRITEGYSVDTMPLLRTTKGELKLSNATFSTIFERESAASQVTWNPNLHCGGWAAAGMGSGLVRVEDLAI